MNAALIIARACRRSGTLVPFLGSTQDNLLRAVIEETAAPELYEALQLFVDAADRGATNFFDMRGSCLSKARAALAKAEP